MRPTIAALVFLVAAGPASAPRAAGQDPGPSPLPPGRAAALDRISADSLRGHLSFLASDLLEGRDTPSRGLDIAAEYIAAQYRRAGLEPIGDDGYFQTATWRVAEPDAATFRLTMRLAGDVYEVPNGSVSLAADGPLAVPAVALVRVDYARLAAGDVAAKDVKERGLVIVPPEGKGAAAIDPRALQTRLRGLQPAVTFLVDRDPAAARGVRGSRLIDPENPGGGRPRRGLFGAATPVVTLHDPRIADLLAALNGPVEATATLRLGPPVERPVKLRNVAGLLRGSDPTLKDTYVLLTAHYDHVGIGTPQGGDAIYNGANDDGSGTVSVVEIASALATLAERPKRSLLFLTVWGEEHGLLGSRYYGKHPLVPIEATVADVNLEQVGRTDSSEGPQIAAASLTGFDFSDVGETFRKAGEAEGVKVFKHPRNSDAYFGASDNQALADLGVPAHTLCVAYQYPDYHGAADHWPKVDYANMARIDRVVARALLDIADSAEPPRWNAENPKTKRYLKAHNDRRPAPAKADAAEGR